MRRGGFIDGLSHSLRNGGEFVILQIYADESGIHDGATVCAVAGFQADVRRWSVFESDWLAILKKYQISHFHSKEYFSRSGEFYGWDDAKREAFGDAVISAIERFAPNIRKVIIGKQVLTPKDIEDITCITGGNIFHGELLLHQLFFMRPATKWASFHTPINGYYLAGSGAHPGGGIMGAPGKLGAEVALKDGF